MTVITSEKHSNSKENFIAPLIFALATTFFLFFIDEGYYNLNWMQNIGNWIAFVIYTIGLLFGQVIANLLILRNYKGKRKTILSAVIGIPLGIAFVVGLFLLKGVN